MNDPITRTSLLRAPGQPSRLRVRSIALTVLGDKPSEHRFELETLRIGSADECDLVLRDPSVSRRHCRVFLEAGRFVVRDEGSKNGTFVDDVPIREAFLLPGARLRLGSVVLRFETREQDEELAPSARARFGELVGTSAPMREAFAVLERVASMDSTVIVLGETGTGKELAARALHDRSPRREQPFVVVDCGAISRHLVESELFGHERGAFTGALEQKRGAFELAEGGTIFLDEIGDLPLEMQVKLLRVLERHEIKRVGGDDYFPVDVRVIAATHRDLAQLARSGAFREDLLFRLEVVSVRLPPLRDRKEDIPLLVRHFLKDAGFNKGPDGRRKVSHVSSPALQALTSWDWPGNVRELKHAVERAVGLGNGDTITLPDLPPRMVPSAMTETEASDEESGLPTFKDAKRAWVDAFAIDYLQRLLERHHGKVSAAAAEADLHPKYLRQLLAQYRLGSYADE